jgi:hypothetical protein
MEHSKYSFTHAESVRLFKNNLKLCELVSELRIENKIWKAKYDDLKKATDHLDLKGLNPILNPRPDGKSK